MNKVASVANKFLKKYLKSSEEKKIIKPIYLGIFLNEESQKKLKAWCESEKITLLPKVHSKHVTVLSPPSTKELLKSNNKDKIEELEGWMGKSISLSTTKFVSDEKGQALCVTCPEINFENKNPHITIAVADGVSPVYSNELIANEKNDKKEIDCKLELNGTFGAATGYKPEDICIESNVSFKTK